MPRFVRWQRELRIGFGLLEGERVVPVSGWIYDGWQVAGEAVPLEELTLLSPCTPSKIIGAGLNYRSAAAAKGKAFDGFQPLGSAIVTELDPGCVPLEMWLNGEQVQRGNTDDLIFSVAELVSAASQIMTLEPGDVLLSGTPPGSGSLTVGDQIEACSEPLGRLANIVAAEADQVGR